MHGPLMVCGFLGTLIALERAIGLPGRWPYLAPALGVLTAAPLLTGSFDQVAPWLALTASLVFALVTLKVATLQSALFTRVMALGASFWCVGNLGWALGWPLTRVAPFWVSFLTLTIVGERLDLSRFQRPSRVARPLLAGALGLHLAGPLLTFVHESAGVRIAGLGLLLIAGWLGAFDLARRTIRQPGLPRFMAICLMSGFGWLAVCGVLWAAFGPSVAGGSYDAILHAFFVGFVFSMIFGHAPIIFPAVLEVRPAFRPAFYAHVGLLQVGLAIRLAGDLGGLPEWRSTGGLLNALAIALFLTNTLGGIVYPPRPLTRGT